MPKARKARKACDDDDYDPENRRELRPRSEPPKTATKRKREVSPVNPKETNSRKVTGPVLELVDPKLLKGYKVNNDLEMCYIFDFVPPARQWKAGTKYTEDAPDVEYGPSPWPDLREVEHENGHRLRSYYPRNVE